MGPPRTHEPVCVWRKREMQTQCRDKWDGGGRWRDSMWDEPGDAGAERVAWTGLPVRGKGGVQCTLGRRHPSAQEDGAVGMGGMAPEGVTVPGAQGRRPLSCDPGAAAGLRAPLLPRCLCRKPLLLLCKLSAAQCPAARLWAPQSPRGPPTKVQGQDRAAWPLGTPWGLPILHLDHFSCEPLRPFLKCLPCLESSSDR